MVYRAMPTAWLRSIVWALDKGPALPRDLHHSINDPRPARAWTQNQHKMQERLT